MQVGVWRGSGPRVFLCTHQEDATSPYVWLKHWHPSVGCTAKESADQVTTTTKTATPKAPWHVLLGTGLACAACPPVVRAGACLRCHLSLLSAP